MAFVLTICLKDVRYFIIFYSVLKHIVLGSIIGSQRLVVSVIPHVSHVEGDGRHFRLQTKHIKKVIGE